MFLFWLLPSLALAFFFQSHWEIFSQFLANGWSLSTINYKDIDIIFNSILQGVLFFIALLLAYKLHCKLAFFLRMQTAEVSADQYDQLNYWFMKHREIILKVMPDIFSAEKITQAEYETIKLHVENNIEHPSNYSCHGFHIAKLNFFDKVRRLSSYR